MGNDFSISNPNFVIISLWIAFSYWTARYFQYLHYLGDKNIKSTFHVKMLKSSEIKVRRYFDNQIRSEYSKANVQIFGIGYQPTNWEVPPSLMNPFSERKCRIIANINCQGQNPGDTQNNKTEVRDIALPQTRREMLSTWFHALGYTFVATPLFTEYVLPPLLAFISAIACILHATL